MSLDYQKTMHRRSRVTSADDRTKTTRTTYGQMNQWQSTLTEYKPPFSSYSQLDSYPTHLQYTKSGGYDDNHRSFLKLQRDAGKTNGFPALGPPRLRNGNGGASWRHVRDVLQAGGGRRVFIEGSTACNDLVEVSNKTVPLGNAIHKVALLPSRLYVKDLIKPEPLPSYALIAFKGTERANWLIMR